MTGRYIIATLGPMTISRRTVLASTIGAAAVAASTASAEPEQPDDPLAYAELRLGKLDPAHIEMMGAFVEGRGMLVIRAPIASGTSSLLMTMAGWEATRRGARVLRLGDGARPRAHWRRHKDEQELDLLVLDDVDGEMFDKRPEQVTKIGGEVYRVGQRSWRRCDERRAAVAEALDRLIPGGRVWAIGPRRSQTDMLDWLALRVAWKRPDMNGYRSMTYHATQGDNTPTFPRTLSTEKITGLTSQLTEMEVDMLLYPRTKDSAPQHLASLSNSDHEGRRVRLVPA